MHEEAEFSSSRSRFGNLDSDHDVHNGSFRFEYQFAESTVWIHSGCRLVLPINDQLARMVGQRAGMAHLIFPG
jgi:hypothetical protein